MIVINFTKIYEFLFIVACPFIVALAANYFFQWDFQFGALMGLILGTWNSLYDRIDNMISFFEDAEENMEAMRSSVKEMEILPEDENDDDRPVT